MRTEAYMCSYCTLDIVDNDDPQHGLCRTCLAEHSETWSILDLAYLTSQY